MVACQMLLGAAAPRVLQYKDDGMLQPWLESAYDWRLACTLCSALALEPQQRPTAQDMVDVFQAWRDVLQLPPVARAEAPSPHTLAMLTRACSTPGRFSSTSPTPPPPPPPLPPAAAAPQHAQGTIASRPPPALHRDVRTDCVLPPRGPTACSMHSTQHAPAYTGHRRDAVDACVEAGAFSR